MERAILQGDDEDLVDRILRGDEQAFARLVERHHPRIFRLVRGIVGDWHRAEDVCQDVFTTIYRKLDTFRRGSQLSTWIYRVAVNASLKARRRWRDRLRDGSLSAGLPFLPDLDGPGRQNGRRGDTEEPAFESEEVFTKLLQPLPPKLRVAVVLREQGGLSYDEMASVLECSRGAVEQRLHRAMVMLRGIWKDKEDLLR